MISIYDKVKMYHLGWDLSAKYGRVLSLILPDILERYTKSVISVNLNNHPL